MQAETSRLQFEKGHDCQIRAWVCDNASYSNEYFQNEVIVTFSRPLISFTIYFRSKGRKTEIAFPFSRHENGPSPVFPLCGLYFFICRYLGSRSFLAFQPFSQLLEHLITHTFFAPTAFSFARSKSDFERNLDTTPFPHFLPPNTIEKLKIANYNLASDL